MSCHPECKYQCTDPQADAVCTPDCEPAQCEIQYTHTETNEAYDGIPFGCQSTPVAEVQCPEGMCETEQCPTCSVLAEPVAPCPGFTGTVVCQPTSCSWDCQKPLLPPPECALVCEEPACMSDKSYDPARDPNRSESGSDVVAVSPSPTVYVPGPVRVQQDNGWRTLAIVLLVLFGLCWCAAGIFTYVYRKRLNSMLRKMRST